MKKDAAKDIKIAFFDVDGTLVDMEKKIISPKMIETLKRLKKNGIILCIATGRGPYMVPTFPGIDFDVFLAFNASYCYTKDEVIFENPECEANGIITCDKCNNKIKWECNGKNTITKLYT